MDSPISKMKNHYGEITFNLDVSRSHCMNVRKVESYLNNRASKKFWTRKPNPGNPDVFHTTIYFSIK